MLATTDVQPFLSGMGAETISGETGTTILGPFWSAGRAFWLHFGGAGPCRPQICSVAQHTRIPDTPTRPYAGGDPVEAYAGGDPV